MQKRYVVYGQRVDEVKLKRAREFRHAMTNEEAVLWQYLRRHQLQGLQFRRQQVIEGFIVDFYCGSAGVIVEVDGEIHAMQRGADDERDRLLSARGLKVLRIQNEEITQDISRVLAKIASFCEDKT